MSNGTADTAAASAQQQTAQSGLFGSVVSFLGSPTFGEIAGNISRLRSGRGRGAVQSVAADTSKEVMSRFTIGLVLGIIAFLVLWLAVKASVLISVLVGAAIFIATPVVIR